MKTVRSSLAALVLCSLFLTAAAPPVLAHDDDDDDHGATTALTVSGAAQLDVAPDELRLALSIVSEGADGAQSRDVLDENSKKAQRVVDALRMALQRAGAADPAASRIETGRFNIYPRYSTPRRGEPTRIVGYRVENEVRIITKKLELAGDLIQVAVDAGANQVSSVNFGLSDERTKRTEAIAQATSNARADAAALAAAAGVKLVRTIRVDLDQPQFISPQPRFEMARAMADGGGAVPPPIEPGMVQVSARVTMVYEIADAK